MSKIHTDEKSQRALVNGESVAKEMAARHRANSSVRLSEAMIAWNPAWGLCARGGEPGQIGVCKHPDNGQLRHLSMWVNPSSHAETCPYDKKELAAKLKLMIEAWHIACRDGVPLANIHAALSMIPEYNEMLAEDFKIFQPAAQSDESPKDS